MDTAVLKQKIIAKSKELLGIDTGFASAEPFTALRREHAPFQRSAIRQLWASSARRAVLSWKIFDTPKTIISIALAYPTLPKNTET